MHEKVISKTSGQPKINLRWTQEHDMKQYLHAYPQNVGKVIETHDVTAEHDWLLVWQTLHCNT